MSTEQEERWARLERSVKLWRILTVMALALTAASLVPVLGGYTARELHAHAFSVLNDRGEEVARLGDNGQGEPALKLTISRNGGTVLVGGIGEDLAGFAITGKDPQVTLSTDRHGAPSLGLLAGTRKAILGVERSPTLLLKDGDASLAATSLSIRLYDGSGKAVFSTPAGPRPGGEREAR
jgi:anti-sigma-K factor RskA